MLTRRIFILIIMILFSFNCENLKTKKIIIQNSKTDVKASLNTYKKKKVYEYDISGWVYISYENKGLKNVSVKLFKHEKLIIKEINTDYSGAFSFKGFGNYFKLEQFSNWYISIEKERYKTIKIPLTWGENKGIHQFINKKLNINIKCDAITCMDLCCSKDEVCTHPHGKNTHRYSKCLKRMPR